MTKNAKPERINKRKALLDDWEFPTVEHSQPDAPEKRLWCELVASTVKAALRGDNRSLHWFGKNGGFLQLAALLDLHPDTVRRIQQGIAERTIAKKSLHPNQHTKARPANPVKLPDPAPLCPAPAIAAAPDGLSYAGSLLEAPSAPAPAPILSDGWIGRLDTPSIPWKPLQAALPAPVMPVMPWPPTRKRRKT